MAKAKAASAKLLNKGAEKTKTDVLADVAKEVENLTQAKAFSLVEELVQSSGLNEFRLGGVLAAIQDKAAQEGGEAWLDGHTSFRELVESRFNLHYRKAMYLISIYKHLVEKQIPWGIVKDVGWTKLKELAPVLTQKNAEQWVSKAAKMTVLQLLEAVKKAEAKGKGSDAGEGAASTVTTMTFKLHGDQKEAVREALDKVKKETKTEFDNVALYNIAQGVLGNSIQIETTGEEPAKPKGKKEAAASAKAALKAAMEGQEPELVLEVFGEVFPKVEITAEIP